MKNRILMLIFCFVCISCVKDIQRIPMECYVYDSKTKTPLQNVNITQILKGKKSIITKTSKNGYFKIDKLTKLRFGMENHKLVNLFFLEKEGYKIDTIETYGGTNDVYKRDSIFMKSIVDL
ncbi:hypothetical protein [Pedobacter sp. MW01-1-1]|uniref:hypothetical protein n=1 Tax=Pedobacter sp. MW01-1-1 TaxID=3383027 RepID=UPI003FED86E7